MGRAVRIFVVVLFGLLLPTATLVAWQGWQAYRAAGPLTEPTSLVIERGAGVARIARQLAEAGVIADPRLFRLAARLTETAPLLQAGEYAFPAGVSMPQVLEWIAAGRTVVRRLTVPEGLTSAEVLALLQAAEGLAGPLPPRPPDGSLLPETYHYGWGDRRGELMARMQREMQALLTELWPQRREGLPFDTPAEALVLASVVEKETAVAAERPLVASVFVNRLRRGMRLQSDPTVVYALTGGTGPLGRALSRADLKVDSAYNTYLVKGLPPGPIANPDRSALQAVLQPVDSEFLYFVADGSGGHAFARTLKEHNRNVARWRRLRRGAGD